MAEGELREFRDQARWDADAGEVHPAATGRHTTVKIRFTSADYQQIALAAERSGQPTTEFVRDAALQRASEGVTTSNSMAEEVRIRVTRAAPQAAQAAPDGEPSRRWPIIIETARS